MSFDVSHARQICAPIIEEYPDGRLPSDETVARWFLRSELVFIAKEVLALDIKARDPKVLIVQKIRNYFSGEGN